LWISLNCPVKSIEAGTVESEVISSLSAMIFSQVDTGKKRIYFQISEIGGVTALDGTEEIKVTVNVPKNFDTKPS
jgi:hypothetical protein